MKPKSALFISAVLTAFVLAILGGVVASIQPKQTSPVAVASPTQEATVTDVPTQPEPTVVVAAVGPVGPEQAATIAAEYMKKTDVYSVESIDQNGVTVFKVVFSSGDIVYVGLDGVVLSTEMLQPATVYVEPTLAPKKNKKNNNNGGGTSSNNGGGGENESEHEQESEHEED